MWIPFNLSLSWYSDTRISLLHLVRNGIYTKIYYDIFVETDIHQGEIISCIWVSCSFCWYAMIPVGIILEVGVMVKYCCILSIYGVAVACFIDIFYYSTNVCVLWINGSLVFFKVLIEISKSLHRCPIAL